jgi:2'-5' RNA ligase
LRLFFALWPPRASAEALAAWAREVQQRTGGRLTASETIHLTLAFLGDADPGKAAEAARRVRAHSFRLGIETSQYWRHNRILWVGPRAMPPALDDLVRQLHNALKDEGFTLEARPFAAHITLIRKASAPGELAGLPAVEWPATEFALVRSSPAGAGFRYETLERFILM